MVNEPYREVLQRPTVRLLAAGVQFPTGFEVDDDFGCIGLLGCDFVVQQRTALFLEVRYTYLKPDAGLTMTIPEADVPPLQLSDEFDLSGVGVSLGARISW